MSIGLIQQTPDIWCGIRDNKEIVKAMYVTKGCLGYWEISRYDHFCGAIAKISSLKGAKKYMLRLLQGV